MTGGGDLLSVHCDTSEEVSKAKVLLKSTGADDIGSSGGSDREIIRRIRKRVVADKSLSSYAHGIKIVSADSRATLNGVVRSDAEKSTLEQKAVAIAGKGQIVNDLKVVAAN